MNERTEVGGEAVAEVPWLPNVSRPLDRHINEHWRSDDIFTRYESPKAAVVRIVAVLSPIMK